MSVHSKMKAICDNIRLRTGGTALLNLDEIAEAIIQIGEATDPATIVYRTIGTTYPPDQLPAAPEFSGYDIDLYNSKADDIFAYIDAVVSGKKTVTKEILGKDASGKYDVARYIYAKRDYLAWVRDKYPKMYAWKNGNTIKYTQSVSPRIAEKAFDEPYLHMVPTGGSGETVTVPARAVIYPGYRFRTVDALITNFHLPESTLIMLVSALAGRENILNAYRRAVELRYRFFSFGDAMFIA